MTTSDARRGFPVGLTVAVAIAMTLLVGLGVWQLQRRAWKLDLLARVEAMREGPVQPLERALARAAAGEDMEFARVSVDCPGLASARWVELYALVEGTAGSRLISACPAPSGGFGGVLVDRGFVADTISARPPAAASSTPVRITGVLRRPEAASFVTPQRKAGGRWFTRDVPAMAAELGLPRPAPYVLTAEVSSNPEWGALKPLPLPAEIPNRHLEYALTWFALAATLAGVYLAVVLRRRREAP
jgi:surfeit locus 1 family protein